MTDIKKAAIFYLNVKRKNYFFYYFFCMQKFNWTPLNQYEIS